MHVRVLKLASYSHLANVVLRTKNRKIPDMQCRVVLLDCRYLLGKKRTRMAGQPCLRIVKVEPPTLECSDCGTAFRVTSDSLREVLKVFRAPIRSEHPSK